jgi:hypothetical protein
MTIIVLDPVQEALAENSSMGIPLAPRLDTLDGKTLGLWNNDKLNAAKLLELIRVESKTIMQGYIEEALRSSRIVQPVEIRLVYPSDSAGGR